MKINKEDFDMLKYYIQGGEYNEIDNWFKKNIKNEKDEDDLMKQIINTTYFFSFSSTSTSAQYVKQEKIKREKSILKNIGIKNKLLLYCPVIIEDLNLEHLDCFDLIKDKKTIIESSSFIREITKLFNKESFEELDNIEKKLNVDILNLKMSNVYFCHKEKYSTGAFNFNLNEKIFSPMDDIILNYSSEKENYLINKNIEIPNHEYANNICEKMMLIIKNDVYFGHNDNYTKKIENSLKLFKESTAKLELNRFLNQSLIENKSIAKKIKI